MRRKIIMILGLFCLVVLTFSLVQATPGLSNPGALETHAQIQIWGDAQFTAPNGVRSGTGTFDDPHIISNWEIDANGSSGIRIRATTDYFRIVNCLIYNVSTVGRACIDLYELAGGAGYIWNCEVNGSTNRYGIQFQSSSNATMNDTLVRDIKHGFRTVGQCSNITIFDSEVRNTTGEMMIQDNIATYEMSDTYIHDNDFINCSKGINFKHVGQWFNENITFSNNTFDDVGPQSLIITGSNHSIIDNTFVNCSGGNDYIVELNCYNSTMRGNGLKNDTSAASRGILAAYPDNLIDNNTIINSTYHGIAASNGAHRTIIRSNIVNTLWTSGTQFGDGGIVIMSANDCVVEYNYVYNHTSKGITTYPTYPNSKPDGTIIRYNYCSGSNYYEFDVEHNATNTLIYGNTAVDGYFGYVLEGNSTTAYENNATNCEIGFAVESLDGITRNNLAVDCTYGLLILYGPHVTLGVSWSSGNNSQVYDNTIIGGNYSIAFMITNSSSYYPGNCSIYNNDLSEYAIDGFVFGIYQPLQVFEGMGIDGVLIPDSFIPSTYNTTNFIINSTGPNPIYGYNVTGNYFNITVIWNASQVIFYPPTSWDRIRVHDNTTQAFITWTEGSVIFGAEEDHEYLINNIPTDTPPQSPNSIRDLLPLMISIGAVVIVIGAIAHVVVRPFSDMIGRVRS